MDSNLKSAAMGRILASICAVGFMAISAKYGVDISPEDQQTITDMVVHGAQIVTGIGSIGLPILSKIREARRAKK
jgi:hypothetical protein